MINVQKHVPLAPFTTFSIGGEAEYFTAVHTKREMVEVMQYVQEHDLSVTIIGGGSNVLVPDAGVSGMVVHNQITGISTREDIDPDMVHVTAGSGEVLDELVAATVERGWWGLENLSHIPGSVGAAPVQNVGAYGIEMSDVIYSVEVYDPQTDTVRVLTNDECDFSYRHSYFKTDQGKGLFVLSVTFLLHKKPMPHLGYKDLKERFSENVPTLSEVRDAVIDIRATKFPDWTKVGTAGSFFKNPIIDSVQHKALLDLYPDMPSFPIGNNKAKIPLAWILDKVCNLRGFSIGSVSSYQGQALVVVNNGDARAEDVVTFAAHITDSVKEKTDIDIEWEITHLLSEA